MSSDTDTKSTKANKTTKSNSTRKSKKIADAKCETNTDNVPSVVNDKTDSNVNLRDQLNELLDTLSKGDLDHLTEEEVHEYRKKITPYGRTIQGNEKYVNFSITQVRYEWFKKLMVTGFVGFLNRMCDEWRVPPGVKVVPVEQWLENKSLVDTPPGVLEKSDKSAIYDFEYNRKWMEKRAVVKQFLEELLQFNPDEHVRSAHRPNHADKERKTINTPAGKLASNHLRKTDSKFRKHEEIYKSVETSPDEKTLDDVKYDYVKKTIVSKTGETKEITRKIPKYSTKVPEEQLSKPIENQNGKDPTVSETVRNIIPPHDVFGRFDTYVKDNYEELREATTDLYCEKSDLELALNVYDVHSSEEEAEKFVKKHRNEVIAEVFTIPTNKWVFFDSFKEQRENVKYYNDGTIILEEIIAQQERDERLGADLMKKRVSKERKKNIINTGKPDPNFAKWKDQNSTLKQMGAVTSNNDEAECDDNDDTIEVGVWRLGEDGQSLEHSKFHTLAEAPITE